MDQFYQNPRALLNLFYPGSFRDPLHLPLEEPAPAVEPAPPRPPGSLLSVAEVALSLGITPLTPALTTQQAAEFLKVIPETIRRLCRRGKLPYTKIGSDYRFSQRDLEGLFAKEEPPKKMSREESPRLLDLP